MPGNLKVVWPDKGTLMGDGWDLLDFRPETATYFQYAVSVGCGGQCFMAGARADIDEIGASQYWVRSHPKIEGAHGRVAELEHARYPFEEARTQCERGKKDFMTVPCHLDYGHRVF